MMTPRQASTSGDRPRHTTIYGLASLVALGAISALWVIDYQHDFLQFLSSVPAFLLLFVLFIAGYFALTLIEASNWSRHRSALHEPAVPMLIVLLACIWALAAIAVDLLIGFPGDINVPWPHSVIFYIAMAHLAEIVFHLVPVALVVSALPAAWLERDWSAATCVAIGLVAIIEPGFQVWHGLTSEYGIALVSFTAIQVYSINIAQLVLFRRYGFGAMLAFRLAYYLCWHIAWGAVRAP